MLYQNQTLLSLVALATLVACTSSGGAGPNVSAMNTPTMVADQAMNDQGVIMAIPAQGGFYGNLYIEPRNLMIAPDTQTVGCDQRGNGAATIQAYISQPTWVTQQVLFKTLDVPARNFLQGFPLDSSSGGVISVDSYFAMDVTGIFHLAAGDTEGDYQFAAIADDSAQIYLNGEGSPGSGQLLVDDQKPASYNNGTCLPQTQAAHMSCTSVWGSQTAANVQTVHLTPGQNIPLEVMYWQGPGQALALLVVYRKVPTASASLVDADCGQELDFSANGAGLADVMTRWNLVTFDNLAVTE